MPSARPEPGWVVGARTVSDKDVATELTGKYSQRVLAVNTHPGSPPPVTQWDSSGPDTLIFQRRGQTRSFPAYRHSIKRKSATRQNLPDNSVTFPGESCVRIGLSLRTGVGHGFVYASAAGPVVSRRGRTPVHRARRARRIHYQPGLGTQGTAAGG